MTDHAYLLGAKRTPIGSFPGALIVTLAHALPARDAKRGVASLCVGGGEATVIEGV